MVGILTTTTTTTNRLPWIVSLAIVPLVIMQQQQSMAVAQEPIVCDCGFQDEYDRVWSEIWYADYANYRADLQRDTNYVVMDYTVPAKYDNTIDRIFDPANVQINDNGGGVHLTVRKQDNGNYTSASFGTKRQDILYGTFRASMKTTSEPGTVAAFFFFRNNTCEIDMESLSKIQNPWKTYLSVQPQVYNPDGSASNVTNDKHVLSFDPTSAFHEYRFDWTPEAITYFLDGQKANQFNQSIPNAPGRVIVNHWTDGNPNFSGAPPTQDATLQLANLTIFFNSSEASGPPPCQRSTKPCSIEEIMSKNMVPDSQQQPPSTASGSTDSSAAPRQMVISSLLCMVAAMIALIFSLNIA